MMVCEIMYLGMTVVTTGDAVVGTGGDDLVVLELTISPPCIGKTGLQESAAAAAALVVRLVRCHLNDILLTDNRFDDKAKVVSHFVTVAFTNYLAGILDGELDLALTVPFGTGLQPSFTDPFRVVLVD